MDESRILTHALAAAWPNQPSVDLAEIEPELVVALRELDAAAPSETGELHDRILELIGRVPTFDHKVRAGIQSLRLTAERSGTAVPEPLPRRSEVTVLYATNRAPTGKSDWYGGGRGDTTRYGIARCQLPDDHRMGRLPKPRAWKLGFSKRDQLKLDIREATSFSAMYAEERDRSPGPNALVFLHGYNVGFAAGIRRTAQLAYDLDFTGVPILYSWPSEATTLRYLVDGENAAASLPSFRQFLEELVIVTGDGRVHLIAHSMGNRILTEALSTSPNYRLGHVVFAAPDVDAGVFTNRVATFTGSVERYTLYVSDKDRPLATAKRLVKYDRAGSAGEGILVLAGIDTIDASTLDTGFLSHSYPMEHRSVVADIYNLIRHNHPPAERFGMQPMMSPRGPYWLFRP